MEVEEGGGRNFRAEKLESETIPRDFRADSLLSETDGRSFRADSMQIEEVSTVLPSRSQTGLDQNQGSEQKRTEYIRYLDLYKAIDSGDVEATRKFLNRNPEGITACLTPEGDTALHIAVLAGRTKIVEELVEHIDTKDLAIKNNESITPLIYAATGGIIKIAECLIKRSPHLVSIANKNDQIPVVVASLYGHRNLVRYLYSVTPPEDLDPEKGKNGAMLVTTCIIDGIYDIALDLVQRYPQLAYTQDSDKDTALDVLAQKPSAFPSSCRLVFWKRWIYNCVRVRIPCGFGTISSDIERPHEGPGRQRQITTRVIHRLQEMCWKGLKPLFPHITYIYELKLKHIQAKELLSCMCQELSTLDESLFKSIGLTRALFKAVKHGIVEFVVEMTKHYPDIIWCQDDYERNIFAYATLQRQEKIFSLIYRMGGKKNVLATSWDKNQNNMLHQAAFQAPSTQLDRVPGAALQMQRELQWFKEVERLVQPKHKEMVNRYKQTPRSLFTEKHKRLAEQGEKWMKDTAESCTVVAALVATMMFSAVFTIPGGYDDAGNALYLHRNSFMVYLVSDAVSLFTSCTSLLMFLGILKSRYREEDFLKSLPTKLMIGLSSLFVSIATMMVTFGATLVILLTERFHWVAVPIVLLGSLPVSMFAVLQFPVLIEILYSTYGPGVFDKPRKI